MKFHVRKSELYLKGPGTSVVTKSHSGPGTF